MTAGDGVWAGRWWRIAIIAPLLLLGTALDAQALRPAKPATYLRADTAALHRRLDSLSDAHHGVVGYSIINLETGERLSRRGD